jgi:hypothetical protein
MSAVPDIVRETDQRLRTWDLTQADRERMCMDVLAVDPHYSDVRPRRPRGGPDGGRDIEAVYDGFTPTCGAVGFRANADDSREDRRWAMSKFRNDLASALAALPGTRHFTFFTNVDLTPSEQDELSAAAADRGISADLYYRERIRIVLCRPEGVLIRARYLKIPVTEDEQFALFDRFGEAIASASRRSEEQLGGHLNRIEFNTRRLLPLKDCDLSVGLNAPVIASDVGTYGSVLEVFHPDELRSRLYVANLADHQTIDNSNAPLTDWRDQPIDRPPDGLILQQRQVVWTTRPRRIHLDQRHSYRASTTQVLRTSLSGLASSEWTLLDSFNRARYNFFFTRDLVERIEWVAFYVDEWALFILPLNLLGAEERRPPLDMHVDTTMKPFVDWPEDVFEVFRNGFVTLYPTDETPPPLRVDGGGFVHSNFALYTPMKALVRPFP